MTVICYGRPLTFSLDETIFSPRLDRITVMLYIDSHVPTCSDHGVTLA